jgi:Biotin-protein ligase, N terminal
VQLTRRSFVTGALLAAAGADPTRLLAAERRPLALVYRGPAALPGCPEALAALLQDSPSKFRTVFCGPGEAVPLSATTLELATLYAQPGGGDLDPAWRHMQRYAPEIRAWVSRGGRYLGVCLGAYLAGRDPGFDLLPGDSDEYTETHGATVRSTRDTIVTVRWRGRCRHMYFQDGACFRLRRGAGEVLATYENRLPAAVVAPHGGGVVGVVGPHPEADGSWYADAGLRNPDGVRFDLGYDLIETTLKGFPPCGTNRAPSCSAARP